MLRQGNALSLVAPCPLAAGDAAAKASRAVTSRQLRSVHSIPQLQQQVGPFRAGFDRLTDCCAACGGGDACGGGGQWRVRATALVVRFVPRARACSLLSFLPAVVCLPRLPLIHLPSFLPFWSEADYLTVARRDGGRSPQQLPVVSRATAGH